MLKKGESKIKQNKNKEIRRNIRKYNVFFRNCHLEQKEKKLYIKKCQKSLNEN